ncbi:MAG: 23S rRNA (adenine(2503)-C(2))-methyltransferase RlmN [Lachnospiraceae bacterium]|nr:23S rRNA (adenine(2503)-C(2))-methyltransferase RlmN [Lachnospiraceae bacterium]
MERTDLKNLTKEELEGVMTALGEKKFRAGQMYDWMHKKLARSVSEMTNLSEALRKRLSEEFDYTSLKKEVMLRSEQDGTRKYLFALADGNVIESVRMQYHHGNSVCISSQVGCRMGCSFCASTLGGLVRNLSAAEMLDQVYSIEKDTGERVSNVVVMGTGEPLDNFDNLVKFVTMLSSEDGLNISRRNITVSTCGLCDRLKKLADLDLGITPAISLHAPNDELRQRIMPVAKKYSIRELMEAADYYFEKTKRRMSFEYSLIRDVNDTPACAKELAALLKGRNCHVNLIPMNPVKERNYERSIITNVLTFQNLLEKAGINVTIRREMGTDINAACGQLRRSFEQGAGPEN